MRTENEELYERVVEVVTADKSEYTAADEVLVTIVDENAKSQFTTMQSYLLNMDEKEKERFYENFNIITGSTFDSYIKKIQMAYNIPDFSSSYKVMKELLGILETKVECVVSVEHIVSSSAVDYTDTVQCVSNIMGVIDRADFDISTWESNSIQDIISNLLYRLEDKGITPTGQSRAYIDYILAGCLKQISTSLDLKMNSKIARELTKLNN